jgi:tRNA(fMet)-specific endonuclease VapC
MDGRRLLDTNIVIRLLEGDRDIRGRLSPEVELLVSVIVMGELYFGAANSAQADYNLRRINRFLRKTVVLECNLETAYEYGIIRNELRLKGRPIPDNDLWIAAMARQYGVTLVSGDRHFADVERLKLEQW